MSLYHSGVRPEIQSKATRVMTRAKMAMKTGANFRARTLKAGSLVCVLLQRSAHQNREGQQAEREADDGAHGEEGHARARRPCPRGSCSGGPRAACQGRARAGRPGAMRPMGTAGISSVARRSGTRRMGTLHLASTRCSRATMNREPRPTVKKRTNQRSQLAQKRSRPAWK